MRSILYGVLAAFFFAFTFVLNRTMELAGGSWMWSASLRYIFMIPLLAFIVMFRGGIAPVWREIQKQRFQWIGWSFVGFVCFYAPLCYAAVHSPGWLIAATWQVTIVSGMLLSPLFIEERHTANGPVKMKGRIPLVGLAMSLIIMLGIVLMQWGEKEQLQSPSLWWGIIPVVFASVAYPLGNRTMMQVCGGRLNSFQRVLGMTLASLPFWLGLSLWAGVHDGLPSATQTGQSFLVALMSGVFATVLFFAATDRVRGNLSQLAAVEATQSLEVIFALIGEVWILKQDYPTNTVWSGLMIIVVGMILHAYVSNRRPKTEA